MGVKGTTVENGNLASFIARLGNPLHTKPHGPDHTIVYYRTPEEEGERERPVNYAGVRTPGGKRTVVFSSGVGQIEQVSTLVGKATNVTAEPGTPPSQSANPNDLVKDAEIVSPSELESALEDAKGEAPEYEEREVSVEEVAGSDTKTDPTDFQTRLAALPAAEQGLVARKAEKDLESAQVALEEAEARVREAKPKKLEPAPTEE